MSVSGPANHHIRILSEGSCDTEYWSNGAENSALITRILKYSFRLWYSFKIYLVLLYFWLNKCMLLTRDFVGKKKYIYIVLAPNFSNGGDTQTHFLFPWKVGRVGLLVLGLNGLFHGQNSHKALCPSQEQEVWTKRQKGLNNRCLLKCFLNDYTIEVEISLLLSSFCT